MAIVMDDINRLNRLISDISDASRLDAEMARVDMQPVDLARLVRAVVDLANEVKREDGVRFSLDVGKQADLVVIGGNPAATISDIRKVETVFKQGIGYDPVKLIASVTGKAGLW